MSSETLIQRAEIAVHEGLDLQEAGDLSGALDAFLRAQNAIAFIPDGKLEEESFAYSPERIADAITSLRRQINAKSTNGVSVYPLKRTRG